MNNRYSVRVAGFGGQGVVTMGYVLANAASLHHNLNALMVQSYGPAARGGSCRAGVILSETPIDYPILDSVDVLVALSTDGFSSYGESVRDGGVVIYDSGLVDVGEKRRGVSYYGVSGLETAKRLGTPVVANMVMLGALQGITNKVPMDALKHSVKDRFPRFADININALQEGFKLGNQAKG